MTLHLGWGTNNTQIVLCKAVVSIVLFILFMCLGVLVSHVCILYMYTVSHNCSSLGSLVFATDAVLLN